MVAEHLTSISFLWCNSVLVGAASDPSINIDDPISDDFFFVVWNERAKLNATIYNKVEIYTNGTSFSSFISVFLPTLPVLRPRRCYRSSNVCRATLSTACRSWGSTPTKSASATRMLTKQRKSWRPSEGCWFTSPWSFCVRKTCCLRWTLKRAWLLKSCGHNHSCAQIRPLHD